VPSEEGIPKTVIYPKPTLSPKCILYIDRVSFAVSTSFINGMIPSPNKTSEGPPGGSVPNFPETSFPFHFYLFIYVFFPPFAFDSNLYEKSKGIFFFIIYHFGSML
jgi:hypothetical protein